MKKETIEINVPFYDLPDDHWMKKKVLECMKVGKCKTCGVDFPRWEETGQPVEEFCEEHEKI